VRRARPAKSGTHLAIVLDCSGKEGLNVPKRNMTGRAKSMLKVSSIAASAAPMRRRTGEIVAAKAPSMALVPLAPAKPATPASLHLSRPDPSFVAHLIAMAQHDPQTRILQRAATADALAAYRSTERSFASQNATTARSPGVRMRLTA
jgi:hypothetical protein